MCTVYTGRKKKPYRSAERGGGGAMRAGEASGGTDKGRHAVYSLRYSRQERRAVGPGIQKRNNRLKSGRKTYPSHQWGEIGVKRRMRWPVRQAAFKNMLNNSSSQVARGHTEEEQSPRWWFCLFLGPANTWSGWKRKLITLRLRHHVNTLVTGRVLGHAEKTNRADSPDRVVRLPGGHRHPSR